MHFVKELDREASCDTVLPLPVASPRASIGQKLANKTGWTTTLLHGAPALTAPDHTPCSPFGAEPRLNERLTHSMFCRFGPRSIFCTIRASRFRPHLFFV